MIKASIGTIEMVGIEEDCTLRRVSDPGLDYSGKLQIGNVPLIAVRRTSTLSISVVIPEIIKYMWVDLGQPLCLIPYLAC